MKEWVTVGEISEALGVTRRAVQKMAEKKGWAGREAKSNGRGRPGAEYRLSCLSQEDQDKIAKHWLNQKLQTGNVTLVPNTNLAKSWAPAKAAQESPPCPTSPNGGEESRVQAVLQTGTPPGGAVATIPVTPVIPKRSDEIGLAKFNLVHAWRDILDSQPHGRKGEATSAFLFAYNTGKLLPNIFDKVGVISDSSLRDMDKRLRESRLQNFGNEDYLVLCDGRGGWRKHGTTKWRSRSLSNEAADAFLSCWLRPEQPTVSLAIRAARLMLERRGLVEETDDRTWRRWLDDWSKRSQHIIVLAREGEKAYRDKVAPYISRDDSILEPGQVLIADGHDLNFEILHPATGKPARLKLVMFIDWASRMPVGWQIMPTENSTVIHAALRNALINLGRIPQIVYLDNGKAFKAKVFTDTDLDLTELNGLYARLGIATMFAQPYNARAKIIERFFETLNEQFERLMHSYTGASIGDKPAWTSRNEKFHKAQHARRTGGWIPDIREAAWLVNLYIQWYGQQEHSGIHFQKPAEVLAKGRGPGLDLCELNEQFLWSKKVTPRRCRATLYNIEYESDCLHGLGAEVIAKYDCSDLSKVFFYTLSGQYLGEGLPVMALNPIAKQLGDGIGVDQVKAAIERQRRLAKQTRQNVVDLGATPEQVDALDAIPWREKAAVIPGGKTETEEHKAIEAPLPEVERAKLELVASNAEAQIKEAEAREPEMERPENFATPAARYDWCWRAKFEHKSGLTQEETAFMAWFETTGEFDEYRQRYEDLMLIYGSESM
jgi:putative transposase